MAFHSAGPLTTGASTGRGLVATARRRPVPFTGAGRGWVPVAAGCRSWWDPAAECRLRRGAGRSGVPVVQPVQLLSFLRTHEHGDIILAVVHHALNIAHQVLNVVHRDRARRTQATRRKNYNRDVGRTLSCTERTTGNPLDSIRKWVVPVARKAPSMDRPRRPGPMYEGPEPTHRVSGPTHAGAGSTLGRDGRRRPTGR